MYGWLGRWRSVKTGPGGPLLRTFCGLLNFLRTFCGLPALLSGPFRDSLLAFGRTRVRARRSGTHRADAPSRAAPDRAEPGFCSISEGAGARWLTSEDHREPGTSGWRGPRPSRRVWTPAAHQAAVRRSCGCCPSAAASACRHAVLEVRAQRCAGGPTSLRCAQVETNLSKATATSPGGTWRVNTLVAPASSNWSTRSW